MFKEAKPKGLFPLYMFIYTHTSLYTPLYWYNYIDYYSISLVKDLYWHNSQCGHNYGKQGCAAPKAIGSLRHSLSYSISIGVVI